MNNYELELLVKDKLDRVKAHADHQRLVHEVRGQQLPKKAFLVQVLAFILIPLRLVGKSYVGDQGNRDRNAHQRTTVQP